MFRDRSVASRLSIWGGPSAAFVFSVLVACSSDNSGSTSDGGMDSTNGSSSGSGRGSSSSSGSTSSSSGSSSSSSSSSSGSGSSSGISDGGADADSASMCSMPGRATPGPADAHCGLPDGGMMVQPTSAASCMPDVGAPDTGTSSDSGPTCDYGLTMFGMESDDDDCKYHVKWSSTPICEGAPGVTFTVKVTHKTDGSPLTGAMPGIEAFTTSPGDWDSAAFCDTFSTHPAIPPTATPFGYWTLTEGPPGTYSGSVVFDQAGQWTIRYHFNPNCYDVLPDSPHGHAAYHITVP